MQTADNFQIFVALANGVKLTVTVSSSNTVLDLKKKVESIQGYPFSTQNILFNGQKLSNEKKLSEYHIVKGSTLNLQILQQAAPIILIDIGVFGQHIDAPSRNMLIEKNYTSSQQEIIKLTSQLRANPSASFYIGEVDVHHTILDKILKFSDQKYFEGIQSKMSKEDIQDLKIYLKRTELVDLAGEELVNKLQELFASDYNQIIIRRCQAHGKLINFHTDNSYKTLQLSLNSDSDYVGGRLIYATKGELHQPSREKGTVTIHGNSIAHGVTLFESGIRYGLFLLKK